MEMPGRAAINRRRVFVSASIQAAALGLISIEHAVIFRYRAGSRAKNIWGIATPAMERDLVCVREKGTSFSAIKRAPKGSGSRVFLHFEGGTLVRFHYLFG